MRVLVDRMKRIKNKNHVTLRLWLMRQVPFSSHLAHPNSHPTMTWIVQGKRTRCSSKLPLCPSCHASLRRTKLTIAIHYLEILFIYFILKGLPRNSTKTILIGPTVNEESDNDPQPLDNQPSVGYPVATNRWSPAIVDSPHTLHAIWWRGNLPHSHPW